MHRLYRYQDFTIEVDAEPVDGNPGGKVRSMAAGYVAVVHISCGASSTTIQQLSFVQGDGRAFDSEAEALTRGYGAAQSIIDGLVTGGALRSMR
jgi:hypothetical protein